MDCHKRVACDRCRQQKLRCLRVDSSQDTQPCTRCARLGAVCVTGSARPLGRPRTAAASQGVNKAAAPPKRTGRRNAPNTLPPSKRSVRVSNDRALEVRANTMQDGVRPFSPSRFDHDLMTPSGSSDMDIFFHDQVPVHGDLFDRTNSPLCTLNGSPLADLMLGDTRGNLLSPRPERMADLLGRLSRLNESFARQLSMLESFDWGFAGRGLECVEAFNHPHANPAVQTMQIASQFINILEELVPRPKAPSVPFSILPAQDATPGLAGFAHDAHNQPPSIWAQDAGHRAPERPCRLSTPILLQILSNYLQVLELYDTLFFHAYHVLRAIPDVNNFFQHWPDFHLHGFPPMKGPLYLKIIVLVVENNLQRMEQLLDIPLDSRLSTPTTHAAGVFSHEDVSEMLRAAMLNLTRGQKGRSGVSLVASLRHNLHLLHSVLAT